MSAFNPEIIELSKKFAERITTESCILEIHILQPGFRKSVNSYAFLTANGNALGIDSSAIKVSKDLLEKADLKRLETHRSAFLKTLKGYSIPSYGLRVGNGQYLIPISAVDEISGLIQTFSKERELLLDEFENSYQEMKDRAKIKLGGLYNPLDYPSFSEIRKKYKLVYKYISNAIPEEFNRLSDNIRRYEVQRIRRVLQEDSKEIITAMRDTFVSIITNLSENLGRDQETGRLYTLSESKIKELLSFIEMFDQKNILNDNKLEELVVSAKEALAGIKIRELKTNNEYREVLHSEMEKIKNSLEPIVTSSNRKIDLTSI